MSDFQRSMFRFVLAVSFSKSVSFPFVSQSQTLEDFVVVCDPYLLGPYRLCLNLLGFKGGGSASHSVAVTAHQIVVFAQGTTGFPWFYIAEIAYVYLHVPYPQLINHAISKGKSPHKAEQHNYLHVFNEMQGGFPCYVKNISASLLSIY